jgi:hypothetical protein
MFVTQKLILKTVLKVKTDSCIQMYNLNTVHVGVKTHPCLLHTWFSTDEKFELAEVTFRPDTPLYTAKLVLGATYKCKLLNI